MARRLINIDTIKENCQEANVIYFETINSTNSYAKLKNLKTNTLIIVDEQTNGHGKENRAWYSTKCSDIIMTIYENSNCNISKLSGLTLRNSARNKRCNTKALQY